MSVNKDFRKYVPRDGQVEVALAYIVVPGSAPHATSRSSVIAVVRPGGKFGLPGGKIEPTDADPRAAMVREVQEETGLILDPEWLDKAVADHDVQSFRVSSKKVLSSTFLLYDPVVSLTPDGEKLRASEHPQLPRHLARLFDRRREQSTPDDVLPALVPADVWQANHYPVETHGEWLPTLRRMLDQWLADDADAPRNTSDEVSPSRSTGPDSAPVYRVTGAGGQDAPSEVLARLERRLDDMDVTLAHLVRAFSYRGMSNDVRLGAFLVPGPVRHIAEGKHTPRYLPLHRSVVWYAGDRVLLTIGQTSEVIAVLVIEDD
jgi:8-oxo-dGTP pyrophosphatase MutT (NUDIX family)